MILVSEHAALASLVRSSFYHFVKEFWDIVVEEEPVFNWHIKYICDELQKVAERVFADLPKEYDLVINVPPGSTKSTICSVMLPAWCWARMPSSKFIYASYAQQVAMKDSLKTRDIIRSERYQKCFPEIQLRDDEDTKHHFTNTRTGFRLCAGVGGTITGFHGHFLVVDDPLNPEEAASETELKSATRWMRTTLPSRKVDKKVSVTILIQQRLHEADPSGDMLERDRGRGKVKHIKLPAELVRNPRDGQYTVRPLELAEYYTDGLFDPVRMPREVLEEQQAVLGSYGYASQFLQDPVPLGGALFKVEMLKLVDTAPKQFEQVVRSWDKAGTEDGGNWSAGVKIARDKHGFYWVLDVVRGQWEATRREQTIRMTGELDGDDVETVLEIEGGSGGKESGEYTVRNTMAGFRVLAYHPTGDKVSRAFPFASQVGAGNVYVLKRDWTHAFIEELRFFPFGKYDDQVDASSGGFNRVSRRKKIVGAIKL